MPERDPDSSRGFPTRLLDWPLAIALLAGIYLALALALPPSSVWISDEGNRLIAIKAMAAGNGLDIPNPAFYISRELSSFPPPYFVKSAVGSVHSGYHPSFPALCALPYWAMGTSGARSVPLIASLLCSLLAALMAKELGADGRARFIAAIACGLCTPLAFYSQTVLEISTASALCALSALLALKAIEQGEAEDRLKIKTLALAGLLAGLACAFREEGMLAAASCLAGLMLCGIGWRKGLAFALLCGIALLPLWAFNLHDSGSVMGLHAKIYASIDGGRSLLQRLSDAPFNAWFFLLKPNFNSIIAQAAAGAPFMLAALAGLSKRTDFKIAALACCLLAAIANFIALALSAEPLGLMLTHQSLAASLPLAAIPLAFLNKAWDGSSLKLRFLIVSCGLYALLAGALLTASSAGVFWGARHFMPIAPQLCALSAFLLAASMPQALRAIGFALIAASLLLQACALNTFIAKRGFSAELLRAAQPGSIVATDIFWTPEEFALAPESASIVYLRNAEDLKTLVELKKPFTLLLSKHFRKLPNEASAWLLENVDLMPGPTLSHPKLALLELQAFECRPKN